MAQQAIVPLREQSCPDHDKGKICMVCKDCGFRMVCVTCIATTHQRHGFIEIEEFVKMKKDSLQVILTEVKTLKEDLESRLQKTNTSGEWISTNTKCIKIQVTQKAEKLRQFIDEWSKECHEECDKLLTENSKIVDGIKQTLTDQLDSMVAVITRSEVALTSSSYEDVTSLEEALLSQTNVVKPVVPFVQELHLKTGKKVDMATILGRLQTAEVVLGLQRFQNGIEPEKIHRKGENEFGMISGDFEGIPVTIKEYNNVTRHLSKDDFLKEAQILRHLRHPHVIHLYGMISNVNQPAMVLEDTSMGYLLDFLKTKDEGHSLSRLLQFAVQVASGMDYVASKRIINRNLAAWNILMVSNTTVKVADFSLAVKLEGDLDQWESVGEDFPIRWTAVEAFERGIFSIASDVWSFGVLVWEILEEGRIPYAGKTNRESCSHVVSGHRLPKPQQCPEDVYKVLLKCWDKDPQKRPTFAELSKLIQSVKSTPLKTKPTMTIAEDTRRIPTSSPDDTGRLDAKKEMAAKKKSVFQKLMK